MTHSQLSSKIVPQNRQSTKDDTEVALFVRPTKSLSKNDFYRNFKMASMWYDPIPLD